MCKETLLDRGINPVSTVEYEINEEIYTISLEWIISAYLQTEKKEFFMDLFNQVLKQSNADVETFFEQMGQLVLMSSLSDKGLEDNA